MSDVEFKEEFAIEYAPKFENSLRRLLKDEPIIKQACKDKFGKLLEPDEKKETKYPDGGSDSGPKPIAPQSDSTDVVVFSGEPISKTILILEGDEQKIKHLYRKIVQKTHPDKVNSDALHELYNKATKANKTKDILTLYSICNELGIKFNITDKEIAALRMQNEKIARQQINFEKSHLWIWAHVENDNKKKEVLKHFLLSNAPAVKGLFV
jgi:hypothetical protein